MSAPERRIDATEGVDDAIVRVEHVTLRFGGVTSLRDVSIAQQRREILAVIGPNGAGKTSLFNCLTGVYQPQEGRVVLRPEGRSEVALLGRKAHAVNGFGVARTFQNIRLFNALTAIENVKIGVESRQKSGPVRAMLGLNRAEERASDARAAELLEFVGLGKQINELASSLAYGQQRRLEIARALGTAPALLLLDEPAAGTNPSEKVELTALIRRINSEMGVSVLLIEHDMRLVMALADRVAVLNFGEVIAAGRPDQVQRDPAVVEAYLGSSEEAS